MSKTPPPTVCWSMEGLSFMPMTFRGAQYRIGSPDDERLIGWSSHDLPDDEQSNIATRDIRPGVDIICTGDVHELPPLPERLPTSEEFTSLLRHRITVRKAGVKDALEALPSNPHWERKPQLRHARVVTFDGETYHIPNSPYILKLSRFYGLEILEEDA